MPRSVPSTDGTRIAYAVLGAGEPALVLVHGWSNPEGPASDVESLQRFGIDVRLLPRVGHFPMMEDPQAFNDQLVRAVRETSRRASGA